MECQCEQCTADEAEARMQYAIDNNIMVTVPIAPRSPLQIHLDEVVNKTWNAAGKCETEDDHILNAAMGLAGEAGEVLDIHKKMFYHRDKPGYLDELKLEVGDVFYYLVKLMELHHFTLDEVLKKNRDKLFERYEVKNG